ncbi:hypothetical protein LCGC14_2952020, partial [marine sediment metagenome]
MVQIIEEKDITDLSKNSTNMYNLLRLAMGNKYVIEGEDSMLISRAGRRALTYDIGKMIKQRHFSDYFLYLPHDSEDAKFGWKWIIDSPHAEYQG